MSKCNITDIEIGAAVFHARNINGLTQDALAAKIGVSRQQLHKYEHGIDRITAGKLKAVALALNTPITFFFEKRIKN